MAHATRRNRVCTQRPSPRFDAGKSLATTTQFRDCGDFLKAGTFQAISNRRTSKGQTREDLKGDVTSSLAYASGCDCCENRNCKTRQRGIASRRQNGPIAGETSGNTVFCPRFLDFAGAPRTIRVRPRRERERPRRRFLPWHASHTLAGETGRVACSRFCNRMQSCYSSSIGE